MARVKHTLQNGVVHLRQQNSGKLAAIDVSLYEYINEEDKPADEYEFKNGGQSSFSFTAKGGTETSSIISRYGHDGAWEDVNFTCTKNPEWVTVTTTANSVSIKANANEETSLKSGSVELTQDTSNKKITIAVTLAGVEGGGGSGPEPEDPYVFKADKQSLSHDDGEFADTITITSTYNGQPHNWRVTKSPDDWVDIVGGEGQTGLQIEFVDNHAEGESTDARDTDMTLTQDDSNKTIMISFHQDGDDWSDHEITYEFTATPQAIRPEAAGGTSEVDVVSTKDGEPQGWDISVQPTGNWAHATKEENKVTIVVDANSDESEREDSVTIKQEESDETRRIDIYQKGDKTTDLNYYLKSTPSALKFEYSGGNKNVSIDSYCDADGEESGVAWKYKSGGQSWLSDYDTSGPGRYGTVNITCEENKTTVGRNTTLVYEQEFPGSAECNVVVQQAAKPEETTYSLTISSDRVYFSPAGGESSDITISSYSTTGSQRKPFAYHYVGGASDWVKGDYNSSASGDHTFKITVDKNDTTYNRTCTLSYRQDAPGTGTATLIVNSGGTMAEVEHTYVFEANPNTFVFGPEATHGDSIITSTEDMVLKTWKVTTEPNKEWCTYQKTDTSLTINVTANKNGDETTEARSSTLTLTQDGSGRTIEVEVRQEGYTKPIDPVFNYTFNVSPNGHIQFPAKSAPSQTFTVNSYKQNGSDGIINVGYECTSSVDWITISDGDSDGQKVATAQDNDTGSQRDGTIEFKQKEHADSEAQKTVSVSVTQKAENRLGS